MPASTRPPDEIEPPRPAGWLAPIAMGMLLDAVDFMTMGPIGLYGGFVLGGLAAAWAARQVGLRGRSVWLCAAGGAVYAATPATEFLPLGTFIGAIVQIMRR